MVARSLNRVANRVSVRTCVNAIGKRITRLQEIKHVAAPWQQQTIDSILPIAVDLAGRIQAAIERLNENQNYLWADVYVAI